MGDSKVSIVAINSYENNCLSAVKKSIDLLGGINKIVQKGDTVLIKPNFVNIKNGETGNTTHSSIIKSLIILCYEAGAEDIIVGDGSGNADTLMVYESSGLKDIILELTSQHIPVRFVDLNFEINPDTETFDSVNMGEYSVNENHVYRVANSVLKTDVFISAPKLKTHDGTGITISLKNIIGVAPGGHYGFPKKGGSIRGLSEKVTRSDILPHGSTLGSYDEVWKTIIDLNRIVLGQYPGSFKKRKYLTVVDGIVAGTYDNMHSSFELPLWKPVKVGAIIAGTDPVSVDYVSTKIMRLNPDKVPIIQKASLYGLGKNNDVSIVGNTINNVQTFVSPSYNWLKIIDTNSLGLWLILLLKLIQKELYYMALKFKLPKLTEYLRTQYKKIK